MRTVTASRPSPAGTTSRRCRALTSIWRRTATARTCAIWRATCWPARQLTPPGTWPALRPNMCEGAPHATTRALIHSFIYYPSFTHSFIKSLFVHSFIRSLIIRSLNYL